MPIVRFSDKFGGTVCTRFRAVGWVCDWNDGCIVEADAFTKGNRVICYLLYVRRFLSTVGRSTAEGMINDIRKRSRGSDLGSCLIARVETNEPRSTYEPATALIATPPRFISKSHNKPSSEHSPLPNPIYSRFIH